MVEDFMLGVFVAYVNIGDLGKNEAGYILAGYWLGRSLTRPFMIGGTEMEFTLQGAGPFLHWFTLGILFVIPVLMGLIVYKLGSLPGEIATARKHPQAEAIGICGWMGIITIVLWPIAMVWAHLKPTGPAAAVGVSEANVQSMFSTLRQASQRLAAVEASLSNTISRGA